MADALTPVMQPILTRAQSVLAQAQRVLVLTGAGISRSAGIPTFADLERQDPARLAWLRSSATRFREDPCRTWSIMEERRQFARRVEPTPAHRALARWAAGRPGVTLVTQNVDGLHERAAAEVAGEMRILTLHGTLHRGRCLDCGRETALPDVFATARIEDLPRCTACDGLLRPAIVWFGEQLDPVVLHEAQHAAVCADACLVIGTRLDVYPAAELPTATRLSGGWCLVVNPEPSLSSGEPERTIHLPWSADLVLPRICASTGGAP